MEQILFVNACVRPQSRTLALAQTVLDRLQGQITTVDLAADPVPVLDREGLDRRNELLAEGNFDAPMLRHAAQFAAADTIVIAAPYWDLMFPALLKAYLEAVTVSGMTFRYTAEGYPSSLCKATRLVYVTTSGGYIGDNDFGYQYVATVARGFFGIQNISCVRAEGLDIVGANVDAILRAAAEKDF